MDVTSPRYCITVVYNLLKTLAGNNASPAVHQFSYSNINLSYVFLVYIALLHLLYSSVYRRNEEVDKNAAIKRLQVKLAELHLELTAYKVHCLFVD